MLENQKTNPPIPPALPLGGYPTVKFRNAVTKELYEEESDMTKARVEKHRNGTLSESSDSDMTTDDDDEEEKAEAERIVAAKKMQRLACDISYSHGS